MTAGAGNWDTHLLSGRETAPRECGLTQLQSNPPVGPAWGPLCPGLSHTHSCPAERLLTACSETQPR